MSHLQSILSSEVFRKYTYNVVSLALSLSLFLSLILSFLRSFPSPPVFLGFPSSSFIYSPSWVSTKSSVIPPSILQPSFCFFNVVQSSFSPSLLLLPAGLVNLCDSWQDFISILGVWLWFRGTAKERDICIY